MFKELTDKYNGLIKAKNNFYSVLKKNENFDNEFYDYFSGIKYRTYLIYNSMFKNIPYEVARETILYYNELIKINYTQIKTDSQLDYTKNIIKNKIISVSKETGRELSSALLYASNKKIAELSTEAGYFKSFDSLKNKDMFIFKNIINDKELYYSHSPNIALINHSGNYILRFINELLIDNFCGNKNKYSCSVTEHSIGTQHVFAYDLDKLEANKIISTQVKFILTNNNYIEKTNIKLTLNSTIRQQPSEISYMDIFKNNESILLENISFYISPEIKNAECNTIIHSVLFIEDHIENRRWHLPSKFNKLKLQKNNQGEIKLVPSDQHGDEDHHSLKHIPEHCRNIYPHHVCAIVSNNISLNIQKLNSLDLDNYQVGTLFSIKADICKVNLQKKNIHIFNNKPTINIQLYQVKVHHCERVIGVLMNRFYISKKEPSLPDKTLFNDLSPKNPLQMEIAKKARIYEEEPMAYGRLVHTAASIPPRVNHLFSPNTPINGRSLTDSNIIEPHVINKHPATPRSLI